MKKKMKQVVFWIASLSLFAGVGVISRQQPDLMDGVSGFFLYFFLAYCAIIVVAQAFALRDVLQSRHENSSLESRRSQTTMDESELDLESTLS